MRSSFDSLRRLSSQDRSLDSSRMSGSAIEPRVVAGTITCDTITRPCIRVTVDEKQDLSALAESVFKVIKEVWKLDLPSLLISVTGGAKDYEPNPGIDDIVKVGLVDAAISTGAWLITGGTKTGVMELVGDAVKERIEAKGSPKAHGIVAIGIGTWGFIDQKHRCNFKVDDKLENKPPTLKPKELEADFADLDPNYTHFILVNNGSQGKPGGEIQFRSKLETCIQHKGVLPAKKDKMKEVPTVLIVVEGGRNTLGTVETSLKDGSPVVVVADSGRAADYIANALSKGRTKRVGVFFPGMDSAKKDELMKIMGGCLKKKHLIKVFHPRKDSLEMDIQTAVLGAVNKGGEISPVKFFDLAIKWHRWDLAKAEIKDNGHRLWTNTTIKKESKSLFLSALLEDQCNFVKYFLDAGWDLKGLYDDIYKEINKDDNHNKTMCKLLRSASAFFGKHHDKLNDKYINEVVAHLMRDTHFHFATEDEKQNSPERHLFLWAVLFNHKEMAELFWKVGSDHLGNALFASALLKRLAKIAGTKESAKLCENLNAHAANWEKVACEVLDECQEMDEALTNRSLVRQLLCWGRKDIPNICCEKYCGFCRGRKKKPKSNAPSLFNMTEAHEMMVFAGHSACQDKLDAIWKGRMAVHTHPLMIFLCTILPFFLPLISFKFNVNKKKQQGSGSNRIEQSNQKKEMGQDRSVQARETTQESTGKRKFCPFGLRSIYYFYSAPVTKFFSNIIAYLAFLGIFSYFVLIELSEGSPSTLEYCTWVWLFTMFIEEVRQMMFRDNVSIKYRFLSWISNLWNQIDVAIIVLFVVSILLRICLPIFGGDFRWARAFYSVCLALSFIRFMQYFYAVKAMGPKVIMIQKMMADMFLFLAVLLVFVLGFGVAYHANMFPNSPPTWNIVVNVVYYPYFQMYGELILDHLKGEQEDPKDCTRDENIWRNDPKQRCAEDSRAIVHLLLGAYLVMINIMLVNLLIAMFSHTFQEVQDKSVTVWQYYRLTLVHDYFDRPTLVPPFIIVNHIQRAFLYLFGYNRRDKFRRWYKNMQCQTSFERLAVKYYYASKQREANEKNNEKSTGT